MPVEGGGGQRITNHCCGFLQSALPAVLRSVTHQQTVGMESGRDQHGACVLQERRPCGSDSYQYRRQNWEIRGQRLPSRSEVQRQQVTIQRRQSPNFFCRNREDDRNCTRRSLSTEVGHRFDREGNHRLHLAHNDLRELCIRFNQQEVVRRLHLKPLLHACSNERQGRIQLSRRTKKLRNQLIERPIVVVIFRLACAHVHAAALAELQPVTSLKLPVPGADCVGMEAEAARQLASAGQSLPGRQFAADNCQNDLGRQLIANTDIALPREPELHGRPCYVIHRRSCSSWFVALAVYQLAIQSNPMKFRDLLEGAEVTAQSGNPIVTGVEYDSRRVHPGNVFVAMRGETSDGNGFIDQAIAAGAAAVVTDSDRQPAGVAWAKAPLGRRALATLSANFHGHPAKKLGITGITGTNGKSTTTFLLESILRASGRAGALVGTIEYHVLEKVLPAPHTTPEALDLQQLFHQTANGGGTEVVMEVSSHALAQQRTYGIQFDVAVFTNLTRDHLDYHGTMDEYLAAKRLLFEGLGAQPPRVAVLNADDSYGLQLAQFCCGRSTEVVTYGLGKADYSASRVEITPQGARFDLNTPCGSVAMNSPMIGRVNVFNILAAAAAASARGCSLEAIDQGVAALKAVPGRFEKVDCKQPFTVVVDYAHTDDALRNLTNLAREFVKDSGGRVITVFGCGGDRKSVV